MTLEIVLKEGGTVTSAQIVNTHTNVTTKEVTVSVDLLNSVGDVLKKHDFSKTIESFPIPTPDELQPFVLEQLALIYPQGV